MTSGNRTHDNYWEVQFQDAERDMHGALKERERAEQMTDEEAYEVYGVHCRADAIRYYDDQAAHAMERLFNSQAELDNPNRCTACRGRCVEFLGGRVERSFRKCPRCGGTGKEPKR